jgi:hypothetical protein
MEKQMKAIKKDINRTGVSRTGVSRRAGQTVIFVDAVIKLFKDTGATVSIISPDTLHSVTGDPKPILSEVNQEVLTEDGSALKVFDYLQFYVLLKNFSLIWRRHHYR